jgi:hypothetical protein
LRTLLTNLQVGNGLTAQNATSKPKITLSSKRLKWYFPCLLLAPSIFTPLPSCPSANNPQVFACKKCKKAFRKDAGEFEESDEYCPHCDNHFVIDAVTPKPMLKFEGEDARVDSRMLKDDRLRGEEKRSIFDVKEAPNKLG